MNLYTSVPANENQQTIAIIFIVVGIAVLLGVLFFILYKFVFSRNIVKASIKEIQRKYSYLNGLLIGTDGQYIHRLEIVSRTNLLYVDIYNEFAKRFKDIHEIDDKFAINKIKQVENLIANNQFKNINVYIEDAKKAVAIFEEQVNKLHHDLYEIIRPEEESRKVILDLKEEFRGVKQKFYVTQSDVELASNTFLKAFDKLEQCFAEFEEHIDSAEYEEANALIPTIKNVIKALNLSLDKIPNLCALVVSIIPEKLEVLNNFYLDLERQGYPLFHLVYKSKREIWLKTLEESKNKLINLQTAGVLEDCQKIESEIQLMQDQLDKEVAAKVEFDSDNYDIYHKVNELEKTFLKVCALLPEIAEIYKIEQSEQEKIEILKENINNLGNSKRSLDVFIHSNTRQPYTTLKRKLDDLKDDYNIANEGVIAFKDYIASLKKTTEEAYDLVYDYYYRLKSCEEVLRSIAVPTFSSKFENEIEEIYSQINEIYNLIKVKPIDVNLINDKVDNLKVVANRLFDETDNKARECHLAESMILYCNRDRTHQTDVDHQLTLLEERFFEGDFEAVYHEANNIYKRSHVEEKSHG